MSEQLLQFLNNLHQGGCENVKCKNESLKLLFDQLTKNYSLNKARALSKEEREAHHLTSGSLCYGEIDYNSLQLVLNEVKLEKGGIFYDLGSGIGKGVIAASLLHQFDVCKGIELLHSLHEEACNLKNEVMKSMPKIQEEMERLGKHEYQHPIIEFLNGDIKAIDWSDGTFIFASTTCYDPFLMKDMSEKALKIKDGCYFVTITKQLEPQQAWNQIKTIKVNLSWGQATLYIQQKKMNQQFQQL